MPPKISNLLKYIISNIYETLKFLFFIHTMISQQQKKSSNFLNVRAVDTPQWGI
jgi:hypothetical protein